jgi:cation:H+ antiporter
MVTTTLFLVLGLVLLVWGADLLVKGAAKIAAAAGISALVVGLTVVAFGTSAPELSVSVASAYKGQADLALGNVVGSNIFNVLLILGLSAVIIPLTVAQQLVRFDVPLMIGVSLLLYGLCWDGRISHLDGALLAAGIISYTVFLIRQSRKESNAAVTAEYEQEYGGSDTKVPKQWLKNIGIIAAGLTCLVVGSNWLVESAISIARHFGVSELVIGLTIVAAGTSLPEVATSVTAALKGERDIAVGNVVGSNIFNILCVLGFSSVFSPKGIQVAPSALQFDIPVMIAVAVAAFPIFLSGSRVSRLEGLFMLAAYAAYTMYLILSATAHSSLGAYRDAMLWVGLPLSGVILILLLVKGLVANRALRPGA